MSNTKQQVLTIRADNDLLEAMKGIDNRSEFVRNAILAALDNTCPFCCGSGILTPNQKKHWQDLLADHYFKDCWICHEPRLMCSRRNQGPQAAPLKDDKS